MDPVEPAVDGQRLDCRLRRGSELGSPLQDAPRFLTLGHCRIIHAYCFKSLSLGVIGYAARDNEYNTFNFILIITLSLDLPHDLLCQVYFFPGCLHLSAATGLVILKICSLEVVSC